MKGWQRTMNVAGGVVLTSYALPTEKADLLCVLFFAALLSNGYAYFDNDRKALLPEGDSEYSATTSFRNW